MRIGGVIFFLIFSLSSCAPKEDAILRLSSKESFEIGMQFFNNRDFKKAIKYFQHAFEVEPYSLIGQKSLLKLADSYFEMGGEKNLEFATRYYKDFVKRFPTSEQIGYVYFMIAESLYKRVLPPDRDQSLTREAMEAYGEVIVVDIEGKYRKLAEQRIEELRNRLAMHEFIVAKFYIRFGVPRAGIKRLLYILDTYPTFKHREEIYFLLAKAYTKLGEVENASEWREKLSREFPKSKLIRRL